VTLQLNHFTEFALVAGTGHTVFLPLIVR
jgi:hypothetical protein